MQKNFANNLETNSNVTTAPHQSAVIVLDTEKKISLLTPESANLLGVKLQKTLGQGVEVFPETLQKFLGQTLSSGKPVSCQIRIDHASRGEINLLVNATP